MAMDAQVISLTSDGEEGEALLPSVVGFLPSGAVLYGAQAKKRRAIDSSNTIFSAKRIMGQLWHSYQTSRFIREYPFDLIQEDDRPLFKTRAGVFAPEEIGAQILGYILGKQPHVLDQLSAVITVPSGFDEEAEKATIKAGELAGLKNVTIVKEPIATAKAYISHLNEECGKAVVYDLGGGTFDLSVIDCYDKPMRIIAHGGDNYLGGDNIDRCIAEWTAEQCLIRYGWDMRNEVQTYDRLVEQCERAKIRLSYMEKTRIELGQVDPAVPIIGGVIALDQEILRQLGDELVKQTFVICDHVMHDAELSTKDINAVFLAGGATLLPMVREGVEAYFSTQPRCDYDPMEVVSIGASLE